MISSLRVKHLLGDIPYGKALVLLKTVAQTHGFEITEALDLSAFIRHQTGVVLDRRITLVQMQKPTMILGSVLCLAIPYRCFCLCA